MPVGCFLARWWKGVFCNLQAAVSYFHLVAAARSIFIIPSYTCQIGHVRIVDIAFALRVANEELLLVPANLMRGRVIPNAFQARQGSYYSGDSVNLVQNVLCLAGRCAYFGRRLLVGGWLCHSLDSIGKVNGGALEMELVCCWVCAVLGQGKVGNDVQERFGDRKLAPFVGSQVAASRQLAEHVPLFDADWLFAGGAAHANIFSQAEWVPAVTILGFGNNLADYYYVSGNGFFFAFLQAAAHEGPGHINSVRCNHNECRLYHRGITRSIRMVSCLARISILHRNPQPEVMGSGEASGMGKRIVGTINAWAM